MYDRVYVVYMYVVYLCMCVGVMCGYVCVRVYKCTVYDGAGTYAYECACVRCVYAHVFAVCVLHCMRMYVCVCVCVPACIYTIKFADLIMVQQSGNCSAIRVLWAAHMFACGRA